MSGEEEGTWKFDDWSSLVDFPRDGLRGDLISDANIDLFIPIDQWPWSPTLNLSGLLQHINTTNTPAGNTTSLSTSSYLSLLAKFEIRVTESSTNEKLDLRLDYFQILQTARSPPQPQARQNGGPIENESNVISACQSHNAVVLSKIEDTRELSKIKSGKKKKKTGDSLSREILEQHFHLTLLEAASKLKVSKSTLKCRRRTIEIEEWPSCKRNKVKPVDEFVPGAGANNPTLSTSPSLLDQPKPPGSELQREKGKSLCYRTKVGFR
ncbi:unnamed protein product [Camellia sinensis]